ncbi:STAS/SEC14 domain-containing protein [Egicoccus sp. AB-alg6-2]|uniref:STAS/SEC14 domain-containing protein n=1 Tax=Egicoccus sp. AB-alg6-2 TaxID=3242692 RepID=UPI00359ED882
MAVQVVEVGPVALEWEAETRAAALRFTERGEGGRAEAEALVGQLRAWVGEPPAPYSLLVDCSEMVDVDASWRATWGEHFRAHRDVSTLAWFNANHRIQLIVLMFIKGTGVRGQVFEREDEARRYLADQRNG